MFHFLKSVMTIHSALPLQKSATIDYMSLLRTTRSVMVQFLLPLDNPIHAKQDQNIHILVAIQ